jgi:DNA-binding transcriptional MerR regulator
MYTVGQLARRYGLSRSTLLYYDSIGLLSPFGRSPANYRLYGPEDAERLDAICRYREAGLGLEEIGRVLDGASGGTVAILEKRLEDVNREIAGLREQQRVVVRLLRERSRLESIRAIDKDGWVAILRASGLDDEAMRRWHVEFERRAPEAHQDLLESLGIDGNEIASIREWSRRGS